MKNNEDTKKMQFSDVLHHIFGPKVEQEQPSIFYALGENPPHLFIKYQGRNYKSLLNGQTFIVLDKLEVPAPGCPVPERLFWANFLYFTFHNRKRIFNGALFVASLVSLTVMIKVYFGAETSEIALAFISYFSAVMNSLLILLSALVLVAVVFNNFGRGIQIEYSNGEKIEMLPPGQINISPDILVISLSENETPGEFADRLEQAELQQVDGVWIVVIPFRSPVAMIRTALPDAEHEYYGFTFQRDNPDYQGDEWPEDQRITRQGIRFENETWGDYQRYLNEFISHFTEWAQIKKATMGQNPFNSIKAAARKTATILTLLIFCTSVLFSQKSAQAAKYLGYRYDHDAPKGEVRFVFQKVELRRMGDGEKTYKELLPDGVLFSDSDNAGRLIGITVDGSVINPVSPETPKAKPVDANASVLPVNENEVPNLFSGQSELPDSTRMRSTMDNLKTKIPFYANAAWRFVAPLVEFLMWLMWFLCPLTFGILMMLNLIGRSARENGNLGNSISRFQVVCANAAWWVSMSQIVTVYLAILFTLFFNEVHPVAVGIFSITGYWVGKWLVNRLTPNGQYRNQVMRTTTTSTGNQQRLNA